MTLIELNQLLNNEELVLSPQISIEDFTQIMSTLQTNNIVKKLIIKDMYLNKARCTQLNKMLLTNTTIEMIDLSGILLDRESPFELIATGLVKLPKLAELNLSRASTFIEDSKILNALKQTSIAKLVLSENLLRPNVIKELVDLLATNKTLKKLDLSRSILPSEIFIGRLSSIATQMVLTELNLETPFLQPLDSLSLFTLICKNKSLTHLKLSKVAIHEHEKDAPINMSKCTGLSSDNIEAFAAALERNTSLVSVTVNDMHLYPSIATSLERNQCLQQFMGLSSLIDADGFKEIDVNTEEGATKIIKKIEEIDALLFAAKVQYPNIAELYMKRCLILADFYQTTQQYQEAIDTLYTIFPTNVEVRRKISENFYNLSTHTNDDVQRKIYEIYALLNLESDKSQNTDSILQAPIYTNLLGILNYTPAPKDVNFEEYILNQTSAVMKPNVSMPIERLAIALSKITTLITDTKTTLIKLIRFNKSDNKLSTSPFTTFDTNNNASTNDSDSATERFIDILKEQDFPCLNLLWWGMKDDLIEELGEKLGSMLDSSINKFTNDIYEVVSNFEKININDFLIEPSVETAKSFN